VRVQRSISRILCWLLPEPVRAISLGDLPGRIERATRALTWSCSGRGLPCPRLSRAGRWALTPPFHPCLALTPAGMRAFGGLFSVALSKDRSFSPWCGCAPHLDERPALWSPDFPPHQPDFVWTVRLRQPSAGEDKLQAKLVIVPPQAARRTVQAKPGGGRPSAPLPRIIILPEGGGCTQDHPARTNVMPIIVF
jgi:hypothetical protein